MWVVQWNSSLRCAACSLWVWIVCFLDFISPFFFIFCIISACFTVPKFLFTGLEQPKTALNSSTFVHRTFTFCYQYKQRSPTSKVCDSIRGSNIIITTLLCKGSNFIIAFIKSYIFLHSTPLLRGIFFLPTLCLLLMTKRVNQGMIIKP